MSQLNLYCPTCSDSGCFVECSCCHASYIDISPKVYSTSHVDYPPPVNAAEYAVSLHTISQIQADLAWRKDIIRSLEASVRSLEGHLTLQRFRIAPIRKVPSEILQIIFRKSVANDSNQPLEGKIPAKSLSHVCASWREITLDMPSLWNKFSFTSIATGMPLSSYKSRHVTDMVSACLSRSGDSSLHIRFCISDSNLSSLRRKNASFFPLLLQSTARWGTLTLSPRMQPFFRGLPFTRLASCTLLVFFGLAGDGHDLEFLSTADSLRSLNLGVIPLDAGNMRNIAALQLSHLTGRMSSSILADQALAHLTELSMKKHSFDELDSNLPPRNIRLARLRSLSITCSGSVPRPNSSGFFGRLIAPSLSRLSLCRVALNGADHQTLCRMLAQGNSTLQSLELEQCTITSTRLGSLLSTVPLLTVLSVLKVGPKGDGGFDALDASLFARIKLSKLLPRLRSLKINPIYPREDMFPAEELMDYLEHRMFAASSSPHSLKKIELWIDKQWKYPLRVAQETRRDREGYKVDSPTVLDVASSSAYQNSFWWSIESVT